MSDTYVTAIETRVDPRGGLELEGAAIFRDDPDPSHRRVQMPDEGLGTRLKHPAQRFRGRERRAHIRSDGDLASPRRVSRRREVGQIGHHAQIFRVELAGLVVRQDPDRSNGLPTHVERDQQPLFHGGLHRGEVFEIPFGAREQQRGVPIQDRATGAEVAPRPLPQVRRPLPGHGWPAEALPIPVDHADPRRVRAAQVQSGLHQVLQNVVRRRRHRLD